MSNIKQIFVVGSSRSGTTMMGRILGNHSDIFTFKELHFFGTLWTNNSSQDLNRQEQIDLLSRLLCIQENGLFNQQNISVFHEKAIALLVHKNICNPLSIYELFLSTMSNKNKSIISCEQTPKNMYYLNEILAFFPQAKVINMVRDQRDVLLSQKNKWKRRFLGASKIPFSEAIRSYINYHPILTSKVWNSSLEHTAKYFDNERVKIVKFEELLAKSEFVVKDICHFLAIEFYAEMLNVPVVGSSTEQDNKHSFFMDSSKIEKWKNGGLNSAEIYLSQLTSHKMMSKFSYHFEKFQLPPLLSIFYIITLPVKLGLAFLLNIKRMGNMFEVINKRFF
jgi:omega-hydroxy-beta-dihydromenaquinone-9 sulfotransferase